MVPTPTLVFVYSVLPARVCALKLAISSNASYGRTLATGDRQETGPLLVWVAQSVGRSLDTHVLYENSSDLFASYWVVVLNGAEPRWRCLVQRLPLLSGYIAFVEHTYSCILMCWLSGRLPGPIPIKCRGKGGQSMQTVLWGAPVNDCCCTRIDFLGKEGGNSEINLNFN